MTTLQHDEAADEVYPGQPRNTKRRLGTNVERCLARGDAPVCAYCTAALAHPTIPDSFVWHETLPTGLDPEWDYADPDDYGWHPITATGYEWAQADHVIPRARGGTDDLDNLVLACPSCNASKCDALVADWLARLAERPPSRYERERERVGRILARAER